MGRKLTMGQLAALAAADARKVDPNAHKALRKMGFDGASLMQTTIEAMGAVDTGTLMTSVSVESEGRNVIVLGPTVDYATYVANGTSRMTARPFHLPVIKQLDEQAKALGDALGLEL